jgi:hypothetical protein
MLMVFLPVVLVSLLGANMAIFEVPTEAAIAAAEVNKVKRLRIVNHSGSGLFMVVAVLVKISSLMKQLLLTSNVP